MYHHRVRRNLDHDNTRAAPRWLAVCIACIATLGPACAEGVEGAPIGYWTDGAVFAADGGDTARDGAVTDGSTPPASADGGPLVDAGTDPIPSCAPGTTCFAYAPANHDASALDFGAAPDAALDGSCGTVTTVDTSAAVTITGWCGTVPTPVVVAQASGSEVVVLPLTGFTLTADHSLRVTGARPLLLSVAGDATIAGSIDVSADRATPGPGGDVSCAGGAGPVGNDSDGSDRTAGSGGGGGGFGTAGGAGGSGTGDCCAAAAGGAIEGDDSLAPLRGGCSGGRGGVGGHNGDSGALEGGGGGALQLSAAGLLTVSGSIDASGGGGTNGTDCDGGGGGGSGGAILLEAETLDVQATAWLTANGGGGAGGNPRLNDNGDDGADGSPSTASPAAGGNGDNSAGPGGDGGAGASAGQPGENGSGLDGRGGGGGGGGLGRIRLDAPTCTFAGQASPAPTGCP